jgi:hypothetical protein
MSHSTRTITVTTPSASQWRRMNIDNCLSIPSPQIVFIFACLCHLTRLVSSYITWSSTPDGRLAGREDPCASAMSFASSFSSMLNPCAAKIFLFGFRPTTSRFVVALTKNSRSKKTQYSRMRRLQCRLGGGGLGNSIRMKEGPNNQHKGWNEPRRYPA